MLCRNNSTISAVSWSDMHQVMGSPKNTIVSRANHMYLLPWLNSSTTIHVINLNRYALVPWVASMHKILSLNFLCSVIWNSVWMARMNESFGKVGHSTFMTPCCLYRRTGLKGSNISSWTSMSTDCASFSCRLTCPSRILRAILSMSWVER